MTENRSPLDSSPGTWRFDDFKRWEIAVTLQTVSSLHIGDGDTITRTVQESRAKQREVEVNSIITGRDGLPIIPGSTLKGRLRDYLENTVDDKDLVDTAFGWGGDSAEQDRDLGSGGLAEFHDGRWRLSPPKPEESYAYWNNDRKTYVEVSTAINRHSGSALDGSLHYTECVPPGTSFEIIVTGSMRDDHAALIIAALKALGADGRTICLGAGDANGNGNVVQCGEIQVKLLDHTDILGWLEKDSDQEMATCHFRALDHSEIKKLIDTNPCLNEKKITNPKDVFDISLHLDGPFLVNDPAKSSEDNEEANFYPLLDKDGNPRLPVRSFRGAFRTQAERIIRTLGGKCCDTGTTRRCDTGEKRCLACELFGGTSWKTTLAIDTFTYCNNEMRPLIKQDFVAIDRFHGGAKDGAKFSASYSHAPKFKTKITIDSRIPEEERPWRRGLLALLFRDLKEGDIYLGFGINKGYGAIEKAEISRRDDKPLKDEADIQAFYDKCGQVQDDFPCDKVNEPKKATNATINLPPVTPPPTADLAKFHNPYHFIPIKKPDTTTWSQKDKLASKTSPHSHGFYRSETENGKKLYNGRIICKLTSETPFFIGASDASDDQQVDGGAKLKQPYLLNGEIAIPATTLRGLLSSLAEAASNSAMRVMEGGIISYRKDADKALKKIGIIFKVDEKWNLVPMIASVPNHKQKLKDYYTASSPISKIATEVNSWSPHHNVVYYISTDSKGVKELYTSYSPDRQCGILRILGHKNDTRVEELEMKKHELFIPIDKKFVDTVHNTFDYEKYCKEKHSIPISDDNVITNYIELADQRSKTQKNSKDLKDDSECISSGWLPFHLKGNTRIRDEKMCKLPVHDYGLFYYNDRKGVITEISYSSIWRDRIKDMTEMFFPPDILPFNKKRPVISPAELLFGFTELNEKNENLKHGLAFKGKVRISAGVLSPQPTEKDKNKLLGDKVKLKALSTPKPPCPALYFKKKGGEESCYIKKSDLNSVSHEVQGRKVYLHAAKDVADSRKVKELTTGGLFATPDEEGALPWVSRNDVKDHLKVRIRPVKEDNSFFFHLDFNNLTEWEIGLLCYVLRPDEKFRHKIGMGKPLGLGSVRIDIGALQTIDRKKRYSESNQEDKRYNGVGWMDDTIMAEIAETKPYCPFSAPTGELSPGQCRNTFVDTMDADIYRAFELLGNPDNIRHPLHYPQIKNGDIESENFKWFAANDEKQQKALQPICATITFLQPLTRYESSKK